MANWKDVRTYMELGKDIEPLPVGVEMYPVVGVSFVSEYPKNIHNIYELLNSGHNNIIVNLVRNPDNKYDKNAIEVRRNNKMLGHLSREVAARLAPLMDAGKTYKATVYQVRVSPENPNNPGMDILLYEEM